MNKAVLGVIGALVIVILGGIGVYLGTRKISTPKTETQTQTAQTPSPQTLKEGQSPTPSPKEAFENIKTPHFVSSVPANNAVLTNGPSQVTINFNFDLAPGSKITVAANGNDVTTAQGTKISSDKLSMTTLINPIEEANYQVNYTACWPDGSCHNGSFGFSVKPE